MENIIIVYGGKSCESDISVITALTTFKAVEKQYHVTLVYLYGGRFFIGKRLSDVHSYKPFSARKYKEVFFCRGKMQKRGVFGSAKKIDCALVCCHGGQGENGSLSGYFEIAEIPYTCCGPLQSATCMDKVFTKYLLKYFRLPTLPFKSYTKGGVIPKIPEYPVIVKPSSLGSSIGIGLASNEEELSERLNAALQFDNKLLIEKALTGYREFTCAVMKKDEEIVCSQIEEVVTPENFYSFDEKYCKNGTKRIYPAPIPTYMADIIERTCKKIYALFELKGVVRIDFLESSGTVYVNEINTVPGSLSWYLFKEKGYDLSALCRLLITEAIKDKEKKDLLFSDFKSDALLRFGQALTGGKVK